MKPKKVREVTKALEKLGFTKVRQRGSHIRFVHEDGRKTTVPDHSGEPIGPGLLNKIMKDIRVEKEEFEEVLGR